MPQSFNASLNVQLNTASLNSSTKQVKQALGRITGQASEFQKSLDASTARVFAFGATTAVLNGVTQSFKKLVAITVEVEKRLLEVNSIFQATEATFNRFRNSIFRVAKETGQAFGTVAEGAAELARQGLSAEETAKRLKAALVLTRISGMDAEKSVKALTAAINGFTSAGLNANQIVNKMVAVDTAFAVSTQDLAEAFSRAGSTAEDAGVSFDQLLGLVTAVEQKTARGGAVIGNAFKSIFTRLSRGSTIGELKALGVEIDATQSGIQKLQALSNALEKVSDPTVASKMKELAGGVFQINVVSAALKDLGAETSVFAQAAVTASEATNEAFEKNKVLNQSISAQMNALVIGLTSLAERIGTITFGPLLESLLGVASKFTEFLDKALDPEKGNVFIKGFFKTIGAFLSGPAVVLFTAAFAKIVKLVAKFAIGGLKSLFAMGTQAEKIRQIEGGIVGLLQRDVNLRNLITNSTATQAQKEAAIIVAIQKENALLAQQAQLMRTLAAAAAARGVSGVGPTGFTGRGGRRFNAGFRAEEAEAQMRGAPAGVRGRYSAGTIGGKKFIMNSHETEVPRFGRNGDSAVIPHYAGGFVPNYAGEAPRPRVMFTAGGKSLGTPKKPKKKIPEPPKAIDVLAKNYAFLVPSQSAGGGANAFRAGSTDKIGGTKYRYNVTDKIETFAPAMRKDEISKDAEPYDSRIEEKITKSVGEAALAYANLLVVPKGKNKADATDIKNRLAKGGQRGAHGAIRGAVGAAFEAAVFSALGLPEFRAAKGGADWDVRDLATVGKGEVQQIFNSNRGGVSRIFGDMKVGGTESTVASFIGKILRHNKRYKPMMQKYRERNAAIKAAKGGKAAGFIPNFAGGGVPSSQIRVHRDPLGEPLAVTNTRDEPRGLRDAIGREKKGIGMFAGGFVPNYNTGGIMMGLFALQGVLQTLAAKQEQSITAIEAEIEERNEAVTTIKETNKLDKDGNVIMKADLASANAIIAANKKELAQTTQNTGSMVKLADSARTAANALMTLATINMLTGGGIGRGAGRMLGFGKKGKAAWGAAAAKSAAIGKAGKRHYTAAGKPVSMLSRSERMGRWAGVKGGQAKAFGGVAGKAAGRLGAVGALGMGAIEAWNISQDKSLHKEQKKERMGKTGVKAGMTAAGAALGTMIPIPVLGTLLGAAVGAGLGNMMTGKSFLGEEKVDEEGNVILSKADQKRKEARTFAESHTEKVGRMGFSEGRFEELANENLTKINKGGGDADAVAQRWRDAKEKHTEIIEKIRNGEEVDNDEDVAIRKELQAATMLLVGSRFRDWKDFEANRRAQKRADEALLHAQEQLVALKEEQMKGVKDVLKEAKAKEEKASLMAGMGSAISGKYSGAIALASEQHLMMSQIGVAKAEKSEADRALAIGKGELPEDSDALAKLKDAAAKAGKNFRDQTTKAGMNFASHIKKTEDLLEQNRKKQAELELARQKTIATKIEEILTGKKTGDLTGFGKMVKEFEADMKRIDANVRRRGGKKGDYNEEEQRFISRREIALEQEFARTGYGGTMIAFLGDLRKGLADVFNSTRADRLGDIRKGPTSNVGGYNWADAVEGAGKRGGETAGDATQALINAEHDLIAQLGVTKSSFIALQKATVGEGGKGGVKKELDALQKAMEGAAGSFAGVKAFVGKLNASSGSTVKAIALNDTFLEKSEKVIKDQTELIDQLQKEVDLLKKAGDKQGQ